MGHYYAEMFPNGEDHTFHQRYFDYQRECGKEIDDIIQKNPIKFEEINIGDELTIYEPLKGLSKITFDKKEERHKIRELFDCRAKYYGWDLWALAHTDNFTVYDKRVDIYRDIEKNPLIRISAPPKQFGKYAPIDWVTVQHWVSPKYFQKK
jgi:hypothetical protein